MKLFATFEGDGVVKLISHKPSSLFRVPFKITFPTLSYIFMSCLVNTAMQLLSHICPMDISEALCKSLKQYVDVALSGRFGIGSTPC